MLDIHLARLWPAVTECAGGIPKYWRRMSNGYNVRRVLEPSGTNRLDKKWALYHHDHRVWEVQALPDKDAAIEAAEEHLREAGVV